jgi:hypothetical protein
VLLLVPAAAVVALGLVAFRMHFEPPTVPTYSLATEGGEVVLRPGTTFDMVLRPASPVEGAIGARAFLLRGSEVRPWSCPSSVGLDGSVHIGGPVDGLFAGIPTGPWEVAVAVGRPEVLPTAPGDVTRSRDEGTRPSAWRVVRERIRLEPR